MTDAFPITDNTIKITYDRDVVAATATNTSNYSLSSFGSVLDRGDAVGEHDAAHDQQRPVGSWRLRDGHRQRHPGPGPPALIMTTPQSRTFVNGRAHGRRDPARGPGSFLAADTSCNDRSRFAGLAGQVVAGRRRHPRCSMGATTSSRYGSVYYMTDAGQPASWRCRGVRSSGDAHAWHQVPPHRSGAGVLRRDRVLEHHRGDVDIGAGVPAPTTITVVREPRATPATTRTRSPTARTTKAVWSRCRYAKVVQRFNPLADQRLPRRRTCHYSGHDLRRELQRRARRGSYTGLALGHLVSVTGVAALLGRQLPRRAAHARATSWISALASVGPSTAARCRSACRRTPPVRRGSRSRCRRRRTSRSASTTSRDVRSPRCSRASCPLAATRVTGRAMRPTAARWARACYFARMKAGGETRSLRTVYLGR